MRSPALPVAALLALAAAPAFAVEVTIVPRSELQFAYDDNVTKSPAARSDVFLTMAPGLAMNGEGSVVNFDLDYSPQIRRYRTIVSENSTDHRLSAQGRIAAEPDMQFIDLRAFASDRSATGSLASGSTIPIPKGDRSQLVTWSAEPVYRWLADDNLVIEQRTKFERTIASTPSSINAIDGAPVPATNPNAIGGATSTYTGSLGAQLGSEGSLARIGPQFSGQVTRGRGALDGARNYSGVMQGDVRPETWIDLKATVGYERVRYGSIANYSKRGVRWDAGLDVELSEDTRLVGTYGRRDGGPNYDIRLEQMFGSRTQLVLNATHRLATNTQEIQRGLTGANLQGGIFLDPVTQLPVNVADANFGLTDQLFRQDRQSATLQYRGETDQLSLEPFREQRRRTGLVGTNQDDYGATVGWNHDISETSSVRLRGTMRWSRTQAVDANLASTASFQRIGEAGATFVTALSETLSFSVDYVYAMRRGNNGASLPYEGKVATAVLRKTF